MKPLEQLAAELAAPFDPSEIDWKPQSVYGNSCLAVCYIDARAVMDRLDAAAGPAGWRDDYSANDDGTVVCRLSLKIDNEWIGKEDVGAPSSQKDPGDRRKASYSDALKRAAVKWGIGRYLHKIPAAKVGYNKETRQLTEVPRLPSWALPPGAQAPAPSPEKAAARASKPATNGNRMPHDGAELEARLQKWDAELAAAGRIQRNDLVAHVVSMLSNAGHVKEMKHWPPLAIAAAVQAAKSFEAGLPRLKEAK